MPRSNVKLFQKKNSNKRNITYHNFECNCKNTCNIYLAFLRRKPKSIYRLLIHDVSRYAVRSAVRWVVLAEKVQDAAFRVADFSHRYAVNVLDKSWNESKTNNVSDWR